MADFGLCDRRGLDAPSPHHITEQVHFVFSPHKSFRPDNLVRQIFSQSPDFVQIVARPPIGHGDELIGRANFPVGLIEQIVDERLKFFVGKFTGLIFV